MRPLRILFAEDDPVSQVAVAGVLRQWGHEVISAADGEAAWSQLSTSSSIHLAILDWMMPRADGLEVCRRLRRSSLGQFTYVILLTGRDQKRDMLQAFDAGVDDYLVKPFDPDELRVRLRVAQRVIDLQSTLAERARRAEGDLESFFSRVRDGLYHRDADGRFRDANPAMAKIFGYDDPRHFMADARYETLFPDPDRRELLARTLAETGWVDRFESRALRRDGTEIRVTENVVAVRSGSGAISHVEGSLVDITDRHRTGVELTEKTLQLELIHRATTLLVSTGSCPEACAVLLRGALEKVEARSAFAGVVVGPGLLHVLAFEGHTWHPTTNRDHHDAAIARLNADGYLEFKNWDNLFGNVIQSRSAILSNDPGRDPRRGVVPRGHPDIESFMGLPVMHGKEVLGIVAMANRPGGFHDDHRVKLESLSTAFGMVFDNHLRQRQSSALESQLRQSQKMEAVGQLAGGIAHDFNNLLTIILGYTDLLSEDPSLGVEQRKDLELMMRAGQRAATLTRQLLAFSRKQVVTPQVIEVSALVAGMERMLGRLLGEDIDFVALGDTSFGRVKMDPGQLEQVIMNLAVNARDSMPDGGRLHIATEELTVGPGATFPGLDVPAGTYVCLKVTDSGHGISPEILPKIFEPFFTTKEVGRGTGLGLSVVFGAVKQAGGHVFVNSAPGQGSTFHVLLPRVDEPITAMSCAATTVSALRGDETILVVEDEDGLREMLRSTLSRSGFRVHQAANAAQAVRVSEEIVGPIHLLITDVVMPGETGPALAARIQALRPMMKVLFMSGYPHRMQMAPETLDQTAQFIAKPFTVSAMIAKVRGILTH